MGLFGKSDDSNPSGSFWSRFTKHHHRKQQKYNNFQSNQPIGKSSNKQDNTSPSNKVFEETKKENFRLSLQSLRAKPLNLLNQSHQQLRSSCIGTEQLDSRLRTSKLQCEQLKKKVATISLECNKLENQCRELKEVKEHILSFQSDITMLKRKEKVTSEIQQRLNLLDEENCIMRNQIEKLRAKISDLDAEIDPELINKRLDQLETDSHQLTSITLQNRRDHDSFSLDVGNQLVETFITQQTIYDEFRRLQHRLVSVERQNQIMADLIHFHCHNSSARADIGRPMTNSDSSRGPLSMQASMEAVSSSLSPPSSDRGEAEKIHTSPSNIDWQLTDQSDSLFLCDTLNKSSEQSGEILNFDNKNKEYYKIDFTINSESLITLPMTDLSLGSTGSAEESSDKMSISLHMVKEACDSKAHKVLNSDGSSGSMNKCKCFKYEGMSNSQLTNCLKDDGYYSTSHDGTMNLNGTMLNISESTFRHPAVFLDNKERYFILTKHLQKSHGRSKRILSLFTSSLVLVVKYSYDLETQLHNRKLRHRQHRQRESHISDDQEEPQVFSDTELYGTRFCIDSDLEDDELPSLLACHKVPSIKRSFNHGYSSKSLKIESRHISTLPPLIEHVSERERKIEIKSSKQTRIIPPRITPKSSKVSISSPQKLNDMKKCKDKTVVYNSEVNVRTSYPSVMIKSNNSKENINKKPPKGISPKSCKFRPLEATKPSSNSKVQPIPSIQNEITKPPPIPPRPKKKLGTFSQCIYPKQISSLDYVNETQIRMSPEGCQDISTNRRSLGGKSANISNDRGIRSAFSSPIDEYYIEDEDEKSVHHLNEFEDYFDQEFISELENYQLPKSSVNLLVLQHFK